MYISRKKEKLWSNFAFTCFTWPHSAFICFTWPHFAFTCFRYYLIFLEFETFFNPQQPAWIKAFNTKLTIDLERKYLPLQDTPMWDIFVKHFGKKKTGKLKVSKKRPNISVKDRQVHTFWKEKNLETKRCWSSDFVFSKIFPYTHIPVVWILLNEFLQISS